MGQLTGVVELDGSRVTYSYDPSGQLSSEIRSGSGAYAITYSYDALGNRLSQNEDGVLTSYSYGAANQLQSEQTGATSTSYLYDENGNVRSEQTGTLLTTYTWDEENRLTNVQYGDGSIDTYVYFQDGRRYKAQSTLGAVTSTTLFIWDDMNLLLEENESLIARVQWTNFPDEAREVLVMRQAGTSGLSNGASFFPGFDLSGNTRLMMGAAGISKWRGLYKSFGEERALIGYGGQVAQSSAGAGYGGQTSGLSIAQRYGGQVGSTFEAALNHLRFGGQVGYYTDPHGLIYVRQRVYDPRTGRWISRDPIGFGGGNWNLYTYVGNNAPNRLDSSGLRDIDDSYNPPSTEEKLRRERIEWRARAAQSAAEALRRQRVQQQRESARRQMIRRIEASGKMPTGPDPLNGAVPGYGPFYVGSMAYQLWMNRGKKPQNQRISFEEMEHWGDIGSIVVGVVEGSLVVYGARRAIGGAIIKAGRRGKVGRRIVRGIERAAVKQRRIYRTTGRWTPQGFNSYAEFRRFANKLKAELPPGTRVIFKGSSVTGKKYETGRRFGHWSDYDIAIVNNDLLELARSKGIEIWGKGTRTHPLTTVDLEDLGLGDVRRNLAGLSGGRETNFMIYKDFASATAKSRGKSAFVP